MCHQLVVHAFGPPPRGHPRNLNRFLMFLIMCCCYCIAVVQPLLQLEEPELLLQRRETADQQDYYRDDDHGSVIEEEEEESNTTGKSQNHISLICDKSVTTRNLAFLSYWCREKRLQMHF